MNATPSPPDALQTAGNMLEFHDTRDKQKPGLLELTGISQHGRATMSGLNDYDYKTLAQLTSDDTHNLQQLRTLIKSSIPTEILEHFNHIKTHCNMGLFPEIGRAWLTIDSGMYIWTYDQARDVAYYDGLDHIIVSVGLVKPKPGVLIDDVKHLLLLTTPTEVIVLGVTFKEANDARGKTISSNKGMHLLDKPLFVLGTDNVSIGAIQGSDDGRIFLGGRDGCLYEIDYQSESSWFGKRCKKINHSQGLMSLIVPSFLKKDDAIEKIVIDNSRKLLYVLTEKSSIEAWHIGTNFTNVRRLGKITQDEIASQAVNLIKTVDPAIFKSLKAICPLSTADADTDGLHMLAITQCGVRLYFSTTRLQVQQQPMNCMTDNYGMPPNNNQLNSLQVDASMSNGLYLMHVRLPPGYTPNATTNKPQQVHAAHYTEGTTLMITTQQQEQALLWSISSAPFKNFNFLVESTALEALDGLVWSLADLKDTAVPKTTSLLYNARTPSRIVLLTNQGTHIVECLKAAHLLQQLLVACKGPHHESVKMFFQTQSEREACVTALLLATSDQFRCSEVALWATQAFMLYGGEPCYQNQHYMNVSNRNLHNTTIGNNPGRERLPPMFMSTPMPNTSNLTGMSPQYNQPLSPKHASEVMSLWSILNDHQFQVICQHLTPEQQKMLRCCTFRDLLITRSEVCAFLIISLINLYLKDKADVTAVSDNLRQFCPNLYRHEDEVTYKATEMLMNAKTCTNAAVREEKLCATLQMCLEAAPTLPLRSICQQFISVDFYEGVVKLAAACAAKTDPEEIGIHYYNNNEPAEDRDGFSCFVARMNFYKEVQLMLDHVYHTVCSNKNDQDQTRSLHLNCEGTLDKHDVENRSKSAIRKITHLALSLKDPLIHVTMYEWLLSHDMSSELLELVEPSLGEFLRRNVNRNPENVKLIDLLWKYYEKNGHHLQAAQILDNLAMTRSENISLDVRQEYLVRAVMCMRNETVGSSITNGIFLKEIEDKLEIACVQKSVLAAMNSLASNNQEARQAVKELNFALYDITQLYQHFAEPFQLWECQLSILNCSNHNDPLLIESVWGNIINAAVETQGSTQERTIRLFTKIELLVREFGESGPCFPFAFLIRELEIRACQLRLPEGTVPEKLFAMKLDIELLLEYYSRMISMNERIWANEGNEWQLIQSAIRVVTLLADNAQAIWYRSKRRVLGKAQDIVAACLNICYQKPDTHRLQSSLKELQCRLQRLLG
ncbi:Nup154 [Drosophila busckii]|uniref:Nup154 n=1 Tax=Drosophila busckii TaxID=30019 RepID=A0A0M4EAA4_DROBS|nr:Nup154 [Drosophila busckii]